MYCNYKCNSTYFEINSYFITESLLSITKTVMVDKVIHSSLITVKSNSKLSWVLSILVL